MSYHGHVRHAISPYVAAGPAYVDEYEAVPAGSGSTVAWRHTFGYNAGTGILFQSLSRHTMIPLAFIGAQYQHAPGHGIFPPADVLAVTVGFSEVMLGGR